MSALALRVQSRKQHNYRAPSVLQLVFDRHVVVSRWHRMGFWAAGVLVPGCILAAIHLLPSRRSASLSPMEVVLISPSAPKPVVPPALSKTVPKRSKPKHRSRARPRVMAPDPKIRARAGKIIAATPEPVATPAAAANTTVSGESEAYAGGATASSGMGKNAVEDVPKPPPALPKPSVDVVAVTRAYLAKIRELLAQKKRYPLTAQRLGVEGLVVVSFVIEASGRFENIQVVSSSGSDLLDDAAIDAVKTLSGKVFRPRPTGTLALPLKTALRFELAR